MSPHFRFLHDTQALDAALVRAADQPIVLFKHSPTCGISAQACEDLSNWIDRHDARVPVYLVNVREHRGLSALIAERFRVRHESPQALVVEAGTLRWHGSHFHVNAREIQSALGAVSAAFGR